MSFHDKNVYIVFDTIHEVIQMLQLRMRKESNSKELVILLVILPKSFHLKMSEEHVSRYHLII